MASPLFDGYSYRLQLQDAHHDPVREPTPPPVEEERPHKRAKVLEEPTLNWLPTTATVSSTERTRGVPKIPVFDGCRPQPPEPPKKEAVEAVIAAARAAAVAAAIQKAEEEARELAVAEAKALQIEKKQARKEEKEKKKPGLNKEEKEALKEKKLKKMVGAVVVKTMSRYQKYLDHEQFKKYAKEVCVFFHVLLPLLTNRGLADGGHCREGEEVLKLQRRETRRILG